MPYCPKCGKEVPADAIYCPYCGSPIHAPIHAPPTPPPKKEAAKLRRVAAYAVGIVVCIMVVTAILSFLWRAPSATDYLKQGVTLFEEGKYEQAIDEYTKAIELDPNLTDAYYNRGLAYLMTKQYDLALADFNKAIELDPKMSTAWSGRGMALAGLGRYKEALEAYDKALEINPNDQLAKESREGLLAYLASLPIIYGGGSLGLQARTTEIEGGGVYKIVRTATCTTYGHPFELKLYRVILDGQPIYFGTAETTLYYEGDWSVTVTQTSEGERIDVDPSSGHVSGEARVVIVGVWKEGTLGLVVLPYPPESLQIWVKVKFSYYSPGGKLISTSTSDLPILHPFYDLQLSFLDASYYSSPYMFEGKLPSSIPTSMEEISQMRLDDVLSLLGYKWTKIRFPGATSLDVYFSGTLALPNPPANPNVKIEYNGSANFESNFIPGP